MRDGGELLPAGSRALRPHTGQIVHLVVGTYGCDGPKGFTAPPAAQPYDPPAPQRRQADPTPPLASCVNTRLQRKNKKRREKKQSCSEKRHLVICVGAESVPGFQAALTLAVRAAPAAAIRERSWSPTSAPPDPLHTTQKSSTALHICLTV